MDVQNLINELAEKEITLWCEGANLKYKAPKGAMTADLLSKIKSGKSEIIDFLNEHGNLQFVRNTKGRYEKFPLTDIQNSYVVGRNTMYELGGVACHGYIEMSFDKVLDIKQLEIAWNKVIQKHDMLRAIVSNSGYQIVQEAVPYVTIQCLDLRITEGNNETDKNDFRRRLANKQYELGKWPMCDLALTVENEKSIIHLSLDMLIADFVSTNIILHDLETFYENPDLIIVPTTLYRDVVLYQNQKRTIKTVERNVAEKYWSDKIPSMGEAPDLPLKDDYALDNAKFMQKKVFLNHDMWMSFVENARKFKVTPSILIMASFAEVLGLWSSNNKFCINTTILNRPNVTQDVNKIVGDFTDVNVTAIALDFSKNFIERARTIQNDLWVDLEHNAFSGVEVLRKMTKDRKKNIIIPVVYTSTVGMAAGDDMTVKNPITYKISQTPQVYIDCQAAEENNGCTINWDVRDGVFDDFIIEAMFESFKELLLSSCETMNNRFEEKQPVYLPSDMRSVREKINDTKESISPYMMMEGFAGSLEKYSNKTALITPNGEYTYSALGKYVATVYDILKKIEAFQKDTDYVIDPCLVQLKKSVKENSQSVAKVLFHAGTGTLTPYNTLLSYIEKDSKENEAIIGFTFGDDADYISMETSQTFRLLGEKYGKILNKLGYSNYILIGHCVGGLIALETAQYLQKKNVQVSDVTLISSNIPKQKNQTILSQATDEIYRKTLQSSLDNEILLERIFAKLIGADAYKAGYQVDEERLQQYIEYIVDQGTGDITVEALCNTGGKFEDVAEEFRLLASKSVSERLNALYNIIERPNGELMEHQLKMLNILFRVFSQNFRCVSTYEPKPYYGNMRILCCEIQGGHFYPGFFAEDYETWKPYAKGKLTFELIKGWHLDCITEPNLGENIKKMLDFNY